MSANYSSKIQDYFYRQYEAEDGNAEETVKTFYDEDLDPNPHHLHPATGH